jgi:hypothetical protein
MAYSEALQHSRRCSASFCPGFPLFLYSGHPWKLGPTINDGSGKIGRGFDILHRIALSPCPVFQQYSKCPAIHPRRMRRRRRRLHIVNAIELVDDAISGFTVVLNQGAAGDTNWEARAMLVQEVWGLYFTRPEDPGSNGQFSFSDADKDLLRAIQGATTGLALNACKFNHLSPGVYTSLRSWLDPLRDHLWPGNTYLLLEMSDRSSYRSSDYSEWLSASD